jgi:hypothetical protein
LRQLVKPGEGIAASDPGGCLIRKSGYLIRKIMNNGKDMTEQWKRKKILSIISGTGAFSEASGSLR